MIDKNKIIENIQKNIAFSNFEKEISLNDDTKECTHNNNWRIGEMRKTILAVACCCLVLVGGVAYAYKQHLILSENFFKQENNIVEKNSEMEDQKDKYLNGYFISRPFEKDISKDSISEHGHNGIDIVTEKGTEILAVSGGIVKDINDSTEYGNYIIIKNDEEYETLYAHLDKVDVKEGDTVSQGNEIGTVGATGTVTGPCLHFELRHNGEAVNPLDYIDQIKK